MLSLVSLSAWNNELGILDILTLTGLWTESSDGNFCEVIGHVGLEPLFQVLW